MKTNTKKWFTLVELTIVITILTILAAISFPLLTAYEVVTERRVANTAFQTTIQELTTKAQVDWFIKKWKLNSTTECDYWVICKLHSSSKFAWLSNFSVDSNWYYTYWTDKDNIYYVVSNDWNSIRLWMLTKAFVDKRITKTTLIVTNAPENVNVETAYWMTHWTENVYFVWAEASQDTNWNWIVEKTETTAKTDL